VDSCALPGSDIIGGVDVLITPEARREIEALRIFRSRPSAWGFLVGHRRGFRFIVEKVLPAGNGAALPDEKLVAGLDRVWPGRIVGLFAVRPRTAFRQAVLGPLFYGKLVLNLGLDARKLSMRPFLVDFDRKFFLAPVGIAPAGKGEKS